MSKIFDATAETFPELVIKGSASAYVLVDYWAPWCNPCQQLKPMLEALTSEYDFTLVKVNTQEEEEFCAQLGIRGIPDVRLYKDGDEIDRFSGAVPEAEVRTFLEKYLPSRLDGELEQAIELVMADDVEGATARFNELLAANPDSGKAKMAAGQFLVQIGKPEDAMVLFRAIRTTDVEYEDAQAMLAMGGLQEACAQIDSAQGLDKEYAAAACAAMGQDFEKALEGFLEVVKQDKSYNDGAARKAMITLFDALGRDNLVVQTYQRRLAMYLN